jgi:glycerol-3-phosphate dehydrogenase
MEKQLEADVLIIGSGITGTALARELSKYKVATIIAEKAGMISAGQTKASMSHIYLSGLNMLTSLVVKSMLDPGAPLYDPTSQKMRWLEEGFGMWPQLFDELDIQHKYELTLLVATNKKEVADLENFLRLGGSISGSYADIKWADKETLFNMEPYLAKNVIAGIYSVGQAISVRPWDLAIAMSDNAIQNGVKVVLDTEVTAVSKKDGYQLVATTQGSIKARFIVNAAGLFADVVADMAGGRDWELFTPRSILIVLDKRTGRYLNNFVMTPATPGSFQMWRPTLDGNILLNIGKYIGARDKYDFGCRRDEYIESMRIANRLIPRISEKDIIRAYIGMRSYNTRDVEENIVEPSPDNSRFINVAVRPPGLTPSPAIAKYVVELLGDAGLELTTKTDFNPYRTAIPRFGDLPDAERSRLIARDPRYGHVVCRCETVTEGEIVEAIRRGARTVAGVKYRTRAGMGRCQGGFCGPRVASILLRELNIPASQLMDSGVGSPVVPYRSKELLPKANSKKAEVILR